MLQFIKKLENSLAFILSACLVVMVFLTVIQRLFPEWSIVGVLELVTLFGVWLYMIGSLIASREKGHLVVDFLELNIKSENVKALHGILVSSITFFICVFFTYLTYRMLVWNFKLPQYTPAFSIPLWIPQLSLLLAALGSAGYSIRDIIINFKKLGRMK